MGPFRDKHSCFNFPWMFPTLLYDYMYYNYVEEQSLNNSDPGYYGMKN